MQSKAKLLGHPIHPMLIVFPLGLLATAVAFAIVGLVNNDSSWFHISFWTIASGIIGGLCAAVFGLVDWIAIPNGNRAKRIGLLYGGANVIVVLLFVVSWFLRRGGNEIPSTWRWYLLLSRLCSAWLAAGLAVNSSIASA